MALINPKCIGELELCSRSDALTSDRQGTATANRQNQRKLNFTLQLFPMRLETVKHNSAENISQDLVHPNKSDTKASASFDSNQKKGRKSQKLQMYLHLHWRGSRNRVLTLQDPESQRERTLESQPVHLAIFTCK